MLMFRPTGCKAWQSARLPGLIDCHLIPFLSSVTPDRFSTVCSQIGSLLVFGGLVASSFATKLWHLHLSFGILTGTGFSLSFAPGVIAVAQVSMMASRYHGGAELPEGGLYDCDDSVSGKDWHFRKLGVRDMSSRG